MELYTRAEDAFIDYLIRHGYPPNRIALEWGIKEYSIDMVILAEDGMTPVAIYEFKQIKSIQAIQAGVRFLRRVREKYNFIVPYFLVFYTEKEPFFDVVDVSKIINNNENFDVQNIINNPAPLAKPIAYEHVKSGIEGKSALRRQSDKQAKIDKLKPICWCILPFVLLTILVLDALCIYELNTERLIVLGITIIIILIPFYSEISLKDFTLKRNHPKDNK